MNKETNFWSAIGPKRQQILNWGISAVLLFSVLPIFMSEDLLMGSYATVFTLFAFGEFVWALYQVVSGQIDGVTFLYRLWWCFLIMVMLILAFLLGGLLALVYR